MVAPLLLLICCTPTLNMLHMHAGSYASWVAGDNLAPATETAGTGAGSSGKHPPLRKSVSGFAANGGAATMAVRKVAAALKVTLLHTSKIALLKCCCSWEVGPWIVDLPIYTMNEAYAQPAK